jgi:hypothetical protein
MGAGVMMHRSQSQWRRMQWRGWLSDCGLQQAQLWAGRVGRCCGDGLRRELGVGSVCVKASMAVTFREAFFPKRHGACLEWLEGGSWGDRRAERAKGQRTDVEAAVLVAKSGWGQGAEEVGRECEGNDER